jgi:predicted nucleotidyltransferase
MTYHGIELEPSEIEAFCKAHGITMLALFGSILTEDFRQDSDVDVLVRFEEGRTPGLLTMASLEMKLSKMIQCKVDLRTAAELSRYFRDDVLLSCEIQYEA